MNKTTLILLAAVAALALALHLMGRRLSAAEAERDRASGLCASYSSELSAARGEARVFRLRADELASSRDTLMMRVDSLRRAAGVRLRDLRAAHWRETVVERVDTLWLADSILIADMDTVVDDGWTRVSLSLRAPRGVSVGVSVRNETALIVRARRETVRPPRRFPLFRLFQRKRTVVEVEALEGNPRCEERARRHVEIIDD